MGGSQRGVDGGGRGLTPIVAIVVLIGLVVASAITVFLVGSDAIFEVQDEADVEQAAAALETMAHDLESDGTAAAALPRKGQARVNSSAGWIRVEVGNDTIVHPDRQGRLGTLYYESGDTTLAYQGGGVWRMDASGNSTTHVSPPLQYSEGEEATLMLPVVSLTGPDGTLANDRLETVDTHTHFPSIDANVSNPITEDVTITVNSEFYVAWGEYLGDRFDEPVAYDHDAGEVTVHLEGANETRTVPDSERSTREVEGITGFLVNDGPELDIRQALEVNSFNSSEGPYPQSGPEENGDVRSDGDLNLANRAKVNGDVEVSDRAIFSNNIEVTGRTVIGDGHDETSVDTDPAQGPRSTFHGFFSTKQDLDVSGGVRFGDDVMVGGDLQNFEGRVGGSMYVHGDALTDDDDGGTFDGVVEGNLIVAGSTDLDSADHDLDVRGDVVTDAAPHEIRDPVDPIVSVREPDVDIDQKGNEYRFDNDNANESDIRPAGYSPYGQLDCSSGYGRYPGYGTDTCRLEAGDYYLEEINLYGNTDDPFDEERLILDTSDGPINIYVEGGSDGAVVVEGDATIEVRHGPDEHPATIYANDDFKIKQGGTVTVEDDRTPTFRTYLQPDAKWRLEGGSTFKGAVFGLSDGNSRTTVDLSGKDGSAVYGALLGSIGDFDQEGVVHYDEALAEQEIPWPDEPDDDGYGGDVTLDTENADVVYLHVDSEAVAVG